MGHGRSRAGDEAEDAPGEALGAREAVRGEGLPLEGDAWGIHLPEPRGQEASLCRRAATQVVLKLLATRLLGKTADKAEAFLSRRLLGRR